MKDLKNILQTNQIKVNDTQKTLKNSKTVVNINTTTRDVTKPLLSQRTTNNDRKVTKCNIILFS